MNCPRTHSLLLEPIPYCYTSVWKTEFLNISPTDVLFQFLSIPSCFTPFTLHKVLTVQLLQFLLYPAQCYQVTSLSPLLSLKKEVINQCVLLVLTYWSETWHVTKELERKLRSAQRGMERRMTSITWRDKKRASWIREETKVEDILMTIKKKKWTWAGYVMHRCDTRWTTRVTEWQPRNGERNQGRQKSDEGMKLEHL